MVIKVPGTPQREAIQRLLAELMIEYSDFNLDGIVVFVVRPDGASEAWAAGQMPCNLPCCFELMPSHRKIRSKPTLKII